MNLSISSTPATSGTAKASSATSATGNTSAGFAGALVQAIGGGSTSSPSAGSLALPVGIVGVWSQLGLDSSEETSQGLLEMIANLVKQLEQLEQETEIPKEAEDQLAALLASLQGLIQQFEQSQPDLAGHQSNATVVDQVSQLKQTSSPNAVLQELSETLQQVSTLLANENDRVKDASAFIGQLKALLETVELPKLTTVSNGQAFNVDEQSLSKQSDNASNVNKPVTSEQGAAVSKEAFTQAAVVVQETRRPVQVLRDPIWRINIEAIQENTASDDQTAIVPIAVASEGVSDSDSQPAWMLSRNDATISAETALVKPALPAQVPVQQFAQQIEKFLVKQFLMTQGNGTTEAKISLTPEHLGQVDIRIIMQNGQVTAQFMADNLMARELLDNQMSQLRSALSSQGLQVDRLEVVQQPSASSNTSFLQQDHRQQNSGNNGNGSNGRGKDGLYEDPALFAAELERNSSLREFGYGSSLNVTA